MSEFSQIESVGAVGPLDGCESPDNNGSYVHLKVSFKDFCRETLTLKLSLGQAEHLAVELAAVLKKSPSINKGVAHEG